MLDKWYSKVYFTELPSGNWPPKGFEEIKQSTAPPALNVIGSQFQ